MSDIHPDDQKEVRRQRYELMAVVSVAHDEATIATILTRTRDLIALHQGTIVKETDLGRKKLAYQIKHQYAGQYDLIEFEMPTTHVPLFEEKIRLSDELLRYLIVQVTPPTEAELAKLKMIQDKIAVRRQKHAAQAAAASVTEQPFVAPEPITPKTADDKPEISTEELNKKIDELIDTENISL